MNKNEYLSDSHIVRKLCPKDANLMLEWMHDTEIALNFRYDFFNMTEEKVLDFIKNSISEDTKHFAIVNENDEYLGTISLKHISTEDRNAEYAISTRSISHGTGIAQKATEEILEYAFNTLLLHKVYLNVFDDNIRANSFYKKCGFVFEGCAHEHFFVRGEYKNLNWYSITDKQWRKKKG